MPRQSKEFRLQVNLRRDERDHKLQDAEVVFEMMRHDNSRVESFSGSTLILVADHPHTIARWKSFVWPPVETLEARFH